MSEAKFPSDFIWGAAAASYQIEGAHDADGKGPSVWDMFVRKGGTVKNDETGDTACDHYNRYGEDVAIMKEIGLGAYRFSVSWPRVIPEGTGALNEKGLDFYSRLVDELLAAGVQPFCTLFHWDFPYALYRRGSWLNPASPDWFAEYTGVVVDRLGDRVEHWMTLNEPSVFVGLGYESGRHAPGDRLGTAEILRIIHNVQLAHGRSVEVIRERAKKPPQVGFAPAAGPKIPGSEDSRDVEAARAANFACPEFDVWSYSWWLDPVLLGEWPADGVKAFGHLLPAGFEKDAARIRQDLDFFGVNIYHGKRGRTNDAGEWEPVEGKTGEPLTRFNWKVVPEALYWGPKFFHGRYGLPVYITENGLSNVDWVAVDGGVHDPQRIDFLTRYLREFRRAGADGVPVRGYFQWSIMDNFEWAEGYRERFGLVHVDYETQKRTLKDSACWYRDVIAANGANL
ncbi:MAG: GH1 family beta-glucosidase [Planctomycetota bacterium]|jgi:beta-glucosidase